MVTLSRNVVVVILFLVWGISILPSPVFGLDSSFPVAEFSMNNSSGIPPLAVQFSDQSLGGNLSYMWNFGDGTTGIISNPVHVFTSPGIYFVTLAVSNEVGTADVSHPVEVLQSSFDSPVANFSVNVTQGSAPLAVQFNDLSSGRNLTFLWTFGDGLVSDIPNPVHLYQDPGTFTVSLNVNNPAGSSTHQVIIEVNLPDNTSSPAPQADFVANRTEGEIPLSVAFTDSSTGLINNYYWDFGDDTTSTERNPIHVFNISGAYSVRLFVTGSAGSDWENKINYINATNRRVDFTVNVTLGKAPLSVQFTDTSSGEDLSYFWDFGDGNTSNEGDPAHTYIQPGRYTVLHRINNPTNASFWDNRTEYIRVYAFEPEVDFSANPIQGFAPLNVRFTDVSPIEEIISWKWDFGDGYTGMGKSTTHTYRNVGEYSVTLNVSTDNDTFSARKWDFITVKELPKTTAPVKKQTTVAATRTKTPIPTTPPASKLITSQYTLDLSGFELSSYKDGKRQVTLDRGVLASKGITLRDQEDQLTLVYPSYELLLRFSNRSDEKDILLAGLVSLHMNSTPLSIAFLKGTFSSYFDAELLSISHDSRIDGSLSLTPATSIQAKFQKAAELRNLTITDIAGAVQYERKNLSTGPATIVMGVPSSWVEQHGGTNAIRIIRVSESGVSSMLDTEMKVQKGSQLFFEASSPEGLSWFALVSTSAPGSPSTIGQGGEIWDPLQSFTAYLEEKGIYLALIILLSAGIAAILLYLKKLNA